MALPSSGQMTMTAVATEFSVSSTGISLSNLGTKLTSPISAGNPVNLATSFYGQSAPVLLIAFTYSGDAQDLPFLACEIEEMGNTAYHNGSGTYPVAGDNVYSNSTGTTPLANGFSYKYNNGGGNGGYLNIGANGVVSSLGNCRSDRRLKRNIIFRSYSKSGIPIYEFEYINKSDGEGRYVGTMAQDLIKLGKSEAVITDKKGYYLVNYNKIDVDFIKI